MVSLRNNDSMENNGPPLDLMQLAAEQVASLLEMVPVGSEIPLDSSSDLCDTLELLLPEFLRRDHPEWETESIDGFFFSSTLKTDEASAELVGTCILISDQTVTPFALSLSLSDSREFRTLRIRLGEPGGGPLGISGPGCNSRAAQQMLFASTARLALIEWVYDVAL